MFRGGKTREAALLSVFLYKLFLLSYSLKELNLERYTLIAVIVDTVGYTPNALFSQNLPYIIVNFPSFSNKPYEAE